MLLLMCVWRLQATAAITITAAAAAAAGLKAIIPAAVTGRARAAPILLLPLQPLLQLRTALRQRARHAHVYAARCDRRAAVRCCAVLALARQALPGRVE